MRLISRRTSPAWGTHERTEEHQSNGSCGTSAQAHWRHIETNNPLERVMREIRRRTRVVGSFPDGNAALMLVAARLRHIAGTSWGTRRYLNTDLLRESIREEDAS